MRTLTSQTPERRKARRTHTAQGVLVYFGPNRGVFAGMVCDLSEAGAKIQLGSLALPRRCSLSSDNFLTVHQCRKIWSKGGYAGVAFEGEAEFSTNSAGRGNELLRRPQG